MRYLAQQRFDLVLQRDELLDLRGLGSPALLLGGLLARPPLLLLLALQTLLRQRVGPLCLLLVRRHLRGGRQRILDGLGGMKDGAGHGAQLAWPVQLGPEGWRVDSASAMARRAGSSKRSEREGSEGE